MENTDFAFMKSGFNTMEMDEDDLKKNIVSIMLHFMENAAKSAAIYVEHAGRKYITTEDIKRGLMLESFLFAHRTQKQEDIEKIKEELYGTSLDHIDETELEWSKSMDEDDETNNFTESQHDCGVCNCFNTIYDRWDNWEPENHFMTILKNRITNIENL